MEQLMISKMKNYVYLSSTKTKGVHKIGRTAQEKPEKRAAKNSQKIICI